MIEKIKLWLKETALPFLKKGDAWLQIVNGLVLLIAYGKSEPSQGEGLLGLWIFILASYWLFWKLFGVEKMFPLKKDTTNKIPSSYTGGTYTGKSGGTVSSDSEPLEEQDVKLN